MQKLQPILALENIRSLYNVGSILRTCSFFGVKTVLLVGYSGKLKLPNGKYEISDRLKKTALGAEIDVELICLDSSHELIEYCALNNLPLYSVEQNITSKNLFDSDFSKIEKAVFVLGHEKDGVSEVVLKASRGVLEIPRLGIHNSLNVSVAAAVLLTALVKN
jgi:tRNA G18 (ribose-2'-O)-methylase SpoU